MATYIAENVSIDPRAEIDDEVEIGPFCVIGPHVRIGRGTRLENNVTLMGHVTIGQLQPHLSRRGHRRRAAGHQLLRQRHQGRHRRPQHHPRVRDHQPRHRKRKTASPASATTTSSWPAATWPTIASWATTSSSPTAPCWAATSTSTTTPRSPAAWRPPFRHHRQLQLRGRHERRAARRAAVHARARAIRPGPAASTSWR